MISARARDADSGVQLLEGLFLLSSPLCDRYLQYKLALLAYKVQIRDKTRCKYR